MNIGLSINRCLLSKKPVWWEKTRLTRLEFWAAATSKVWRDWSRASQALFSSSIRIRQSRLCWKGVVNVSHGITDFLRNQLQPSLFTSLLFFSNQPIFFVQKFFLKVEWTRARDKTGIKGLQRKENNPRCFLHPSVSPGLLYSLLSLFLLVSVVRIFYQSFFFYKKKPPSWHACT